MSEERKFGLLGGSFLAVVALILFLRHRVLAAEVVAGAASTLLLLGLLAPSLLAGPRRRALAFGAFMGRVNTAVFLAIVYFLILAPVGFALKLLGRDELRRRKPVRGTMWIPYGGRTRDPKHFEKMF